MQEIKSLLGKPVVVKSTGIRCGHILDVLIDEQAKKITSFVISERLPAGSLLFSDLLLITEEAVYIESESLIVPENSDPQLHASLKENNRLKGKPVVTGEGESVGKLRDFFYNKASGEILGYEVKERKGEFLGLNQPAVVGKDSVTVFSPVGSIPPSSSPSEIKEVVVGPPDPGAPESLEDKKQEAKELFSHLAR